MATAHGSGSDIVELVMRVIDEVVVAAARAANLRGLASHDRRLAVPFSCTHGQVVARFGDYPEEGQPGQREVPFEHLAEARKQAEAGGDAERIANSPGPASRSSRIRSRSSAP